MLGVTRLLALVISSDVLIASPSFDISKIDFSVLVPILSSLLHLGRLFLL